MEKTLSQVTTGHRDYLIGGQETQTGLVFAKYRDNLLKQNSSGERSVGSVKKHSLINKQTLDDDDDVNGQSNQYLTNFPTTLLLLCYEMKRVMVITIDIDFTHVINITLAQFRLYICKDTMHGWRIKNSITDWQVSNSKTKMHILSIITSVEFF